jgi:hypothetical protein
MTTIQVVSGMFDQMLARAWQDLRDSLRRDNAAQRDLRHRRAAAQTLRERIAQYERQQPSYAADLRAALAQMEAQTAGR